MEQEKRKHRVCFIGHRPEKINCSEIYLMKETYEVLKILRVVKCSMRKMKEVDAKHLLFLWSEWAAKQC